MCGYEVIEISAAIKNPRIDPDIGAAAAFRPLAVQFADGTAAIQCGFTRRKQVTFGHRSRLLSARGGW
jgi:hypothetical protein